MLWPVNVYQLITKIRTICYSINKITQQILAEHLFYARAVDKQRTGQRSCPVGRGTVWARFITGKAQQLSPRGQVPEKAGAGADANSGLS